MLVIEKACKQQCQQEKSGQRKEEHLHSRHEESQNKEWLHTFQGEFGNFLEEQVVETAQVLH